MLSAGMPNDDDFELMMRYSSAYIHAWCRHHIVPPCGWFVLVTLLLRLPREALLFGWNYRLPVVMAEAEVFGVTEFDWVQHACRGRSLCSLVGACYLTATSAA